MLKKILVCSVVSMFVFCGSVVSSMANVEGAGDEEITIVVSESKKPKPAVFPHWKHQLELEIACAECHHGMTDDKQAIPYDPANPDQFKIQACQECHTGDTLAGKKSGKLKLDTIKGAGHGNCLACHKAMAQEDAALKAKKIDKCAACHPKKK